jgi:K+-sensing histidine kinase KdpD
LKGCEWLRNLLAISVEDDRDTLLQEEQRWFFNRYFLLENKGHTNMKGPGFGLSCVKIIAETMNGITILSDREGGGSCFTTGIPSL